MEFGTENASHCLSWSANKILEREGFQGCSQKKKHPRGKTRIAQWTSLYLVFGRLLLAPRPFGDGCCVVGDGMITSRFNLNSAVYLVDGRVCWMWLMFE